MKVIPCINGYVVTNGISQARTFNESEYTSREMCRIAAISFARLLELSTQSVICAFRPLSTRPITGFAQWLDVSDPVSSTFRDRNYVVLFKRIV